jgi:integrase
MGSLYKRRGSKKWMMATTVAGRQVCKSSHTINKRLAEKLLARWETEIFEGRFHLPASKPPLFEKWADDFLSTITHMNTKKRYKSSVEKLKGKFSGMRLNDISGAAIEEFKTVRTAEKVEPATINHDLRVLRRLMHLAERKHLIVRTPFVEVEFLKQRHPRPPHIVTFEEEERIISVAPPFMRALVVLILETGMRSHREALSLKWAEIDFAGESIYIWESKTRSGIRAVPISKRCTAELQRWREMLGPDFSRFVFPNMLKPNKPRNEIRYAWAKTLADAKVEHFWIYNLRHTYASRLSAAGVADLFVAQMIGHSTPGILHKYSKAIDEYRREAVRKLEQMRYAHTAKGENTATCIN